MTQRAAPRRAAAGNLEVYDSDSDESMGEVIKKAKGRRGRPPQR